jgi:hypothetical protein
MYSGLIVLIVIRLIEIERNMKLKIWIGRPTKTRTKIHRYRYTHRGIFWGFITISPNLAFDTFTRQTKLAVRARSI